MDRRWGVVVAVSLARMAFGYQFQTMASLGPELLSAFGLQYAGLGTLIGLYMVPGIPFALAGGLLGRRFGERPVVGAGLALMAMGSLISGMAAGPAWIGAGRVVAGAGAVLLVVMQGKMVSDRFEGRSFLTIMGLLTGVFPVGVGLVGLTHGPIVAAWGWQGMFVAGAVPAVLALIVLLACCGKRGAPGAVTWALPPRRESVLVMVAGVIWTAYNAGYYGFLSYMPSLMAVRGHAAALTALVLTLATWLNLPATLLGGAAAGRVGVWPVFLVGTVAGVAALAGAAAIDWPLTWGLLFGTLASVHAGGIVAVGTLSTRPENRAVGMGLFYTTYYVGGSLFPVLCGRAADLTGTPAGALAAAAILSALAIPAFLLHRSLVSQPR